MECYQFSKLVITIIMYLDNHDYKNHDDLIIVTTIFRYLTIIAQHYQEAHCRLPYSHQHPCSKFYTSYRSSDYSFKLSVACLTSWSSRSYSAVVALHEATWYALQELHVQTLHQSHASLFSPRFETFTDRTLQHKMHCAIVPINYHMKTLLICIR